jgi:RNA polymerase sigma-70 factor (ECF subfamily)
MTRAASLLQLGKTAWPDVTVKPEALAAHLTRATGDHPDLYLACGCAAGDPAAHRAFDRVLLAVADYVARIDSSPSFADEVRQELRERLLSPRPNGAPPRIAEYRGDGPLGAWVRVAAVRAAIDLLRKMNGPNQHPALGSGARVMAQGLDPEQALVRARYGAAYEQALREALATLTPKDRNLLRMHVVDGLSVDRIGLAYNVHRATAARWVVAVRDRLLEEIYRLLKQRLQLAPDEFHSLAAFLQSQLDVSLGGLLAE